MQDQVVTRFAPSPTGYLHVGGARTALFNWLWARRTGGTFILRIEDTDQRRNTPTAIQQVIDDLKWLGIRWDEGPEVGGPNGPYLQSQRKHIYDQYIRKLLDEQKAYYCFDTPQELEVMREEAEDQKGNLTYLRPERFPDENDAKKAREQGRPVTVRFAVPQNDPIIVQDVVRGVITFAAGEIGDFIIQKNDGFPTYNFACAVDDRLMNITHVIRGQEHLNNTPGQQVLWQALFPDVPLPKYAHMSVTVSETGGKLSKRERPEKLRKAIQEKIKTIPDIVSIISTSCALSIPVVQGFIDGKSVPDMPSIEKMADSQGVVLPEINIVDFRKSGYLPEALVNFLAFLGWNPGDNREIMPVDELINAFDLSRLTKSNSLFDRQKLLAFNTAHIKMASGEKLLRHFKDYLKEVGSPAVSPNGGLFTQINDRFLSKIIELCEGARTLADIDRKSRFLFLDNDKIEYDDKAVRKVLLRDDGLAILAVVREKLAVMEGFTEPVIENMLRGLAEEKQIGLGKVAQPLRVAICGTTISLPIFESVRMLGKRNTLARIDNTVAKFATQTQT